MSPTTETTSERLLELTLDGTQLKGPDDLNHLLRRRLSLPDISLLEPDAVADAIGRRLRLMAEANRFVEVEVNNSRKMPAEVLSYLQRLEESTPMRLKLDAEPDALPTPSELPEVSTETGAGRGLWAAIAAVTAVVIAAVILRPSSEPTNSATPKPAQTPAPMPRGEVVRTAEPKPVAKKEEKLEPPAEQPTAQIQDPVPPATTATTPPEPAPTKAPEKPKGPFRYSIQLASFVSEATRDRYISRYPTLVEQLHAEQSTATGRQRYLVLFGKFEGYTAAAAALEELPSELESAQAYVIDLAKLKPQPTPADSAQAADRSRPETP